MNDFSIFDTKKQMIFSIFVKQKVHLSKNEKNRRVFAKNWLIFSANICSFHCEGFWKPSGSKVDRALTDSTSLMKPR